MRSTDVQVLILSSTTTTDTRCRPLDLTSSSTTIQLNSIPSDDVLRSQEEKRRRRTKNIIMRRIQVFLGTWLGGWIPLLSSIPPPPEAAPSHRISPCLFIYSPSSASLLFLHHRSRRRAGRLGDPRTKPWTRRETGMDIEPTTILSGAGSQPDDQEQATHYCCWWTSTNSDSSPNINIYIYILE